MNGFAAFFVSALAAKLSERIDPRKIAITGMVIAAMTFVIRTDYTSEVNYWRIAWPTLMLGFALPLAFMPIMTMALSSMPKERLASATGLLSFARTVSGAFGVALVATYWERQTRIAHSELVSVLPPPSAAMEAAMAQTDLALLQTEASVHSQAVMLSTNLTHGVLAVVMLAAGACLLLVKSTGPVGPKPA
jgi:MFS transporter, DHA2 family, multidrug resistance protein